MLCIPRAADAERLKMCSNPFGTFGRAGAEHWNEGRNDVMIEAWLPYSEAGNRAPELADVTPRLAT